MAWRSLLGLLSWYPIFTSSHCNSFEDRAPVDEIYGCPIFKWVTETILHCRSTRIVNLTTTDGRQDPLINSLRPSDAIWWHRSGPTLAPVMAWCLTAPSHYLNQYWLTMSDVLWHPPESNFATSIQVTILYNEFGNYTFNTSISPGPNELTILLVNKVSLDLVLLQFSQGRWRWW